MPVNAWLRSLSSQAPHIVDLTDSYCGGSEWSISIDRWMNEWMNEWKNTKMNESNKWMIEWMNEFNATNVMNECICACKRHSKV